MCTVVVRWSPGSCPELLAVRDELTSRAFDDPGAWWSELPGVVGGRDRQAGGSWCVSDVRAGRTALVLNRPERPTGAPSRGGLPLAAVRHGERWPAELDVAGMASFTLVLAGADRLLGWQWDGERLTRSDLPAGLHIVTPRGIDPGDPRALRLAPLMAARPWRDVLGAEKASDAEDAVVVRIDTDHGTYGTVFAQLINAEPGHLRIESTRTPTDAASWQRREWSG